MSEQFAQEDVIPHGEEIVERFGGIRPMATKLNVPVTTVQGWKKRDAIPAIRRDEILSAAALHNINLKGLVSDAANQNAHSGRSAISEDPALAQSTPSQAPQKSRPAAAPYSSAGEADMLKIRRMARNTALITTTSLLVIVLGTGYLLFGQSAPAPQNMNEIETRLSAVESRSDGATPAQSGFVGRKLAELEQKVGDIESIMGMSPTELATMARNVATGGGASLTQRLATLEQQLTAGAGASAPALADMTERMQGMAQSPQGRAQIQQAVDELRTLVTGLKGKTDTLESAIAETKAENAALSQTFTDVKGRDIGAAAMLLALTQLRQSADRETPFTEDLALLRDVAAKTDPALVESVDKLAPFAESGVLSPAGLKRELLASANDIVDAKMRGEDVSVKDKMMGRIKGLFSVSKDGVPMTGGSPEQAAIKEASAKLDAGDVAGAMQVLQQLQGPAAEAAAPWQNKAGATLMAQQLDMQLVTTLMNKIKSGLTGAAGTPQPINLAPQAQEPTQPQEIQPQAEMPAPAMTIPQ